jgi:hypothetical protein
MRRWKQVKWTEAGQIAAILGWPKSDHDADPPEMVFDRLIEEGREDDAALFLGQALPRFEAVAWAARTVQELALTPSAQDAEALNATLLWLQDPNDGRRRAALVIADRSRGASPQRQCALAVFFSGGSIAPVDAEPILPPKDTVGAFAAGAVLTAATESGRHTESLRSALALGDALASGRETLRP